MHAHRQWCRRLIGSVVAFGVGYSALGAAPGPAQWQHRELRRFKAAEANQGVAADADFVYAIDNRAIGKYRKTTGERVAGWEGPKEAGLQHLNAGAVLGEKLYCAHSNFPNLPEQSSVEIWDTATMRHVGRHVFEKPPGSLTWAVRRGDDWFACFAHYRSTSDPARSRLVRFDRNWRPRASWSFPAPLIERFAGFSASGGSFGPGGHLFVTGHDARELYVLDVPSDGDELVWCATVPISAAGQAFAWDPSAAGLLYSIERKTREVIVSRVSRVAGRPPGTQFGPAACEGTYPLHLQGVATDGSRAIFWSWTDALARTDLSGRLIQRVPADNHHGDLCVVNDKVFVAVNLGAFNEPAGRANSLVYVYDAATLELLARHPVPEVVHGAGGVAHHDGRFVVVGGLPPGTGENYLYEYDASFRFLKRHVLASGYTDKGIQTATWAAGSWWFGCYGAPPVVLRADARFQLTGRWEFDASLGLEAVPDGRFLLGRNIRKSGIAYVGHVVMGRREAQKGIVLERP